MSTEDPGSVSYSEIGGLSEQIRELREVSIDIKFSLTKCISLILLCVFGNNKKF